MRNKRVQIAILILLSIILIVWIGRLVGIFVFNWSWYPVYGHMSGMMPFGMILMVFFWLCITYIVLTLFEKKDEKLHHHDREILKERLAHGEISIEEYEKLLKKIKEE